jgi:hypothetical protein
LAATERARRARGIGNLARIEGIAAAPALPRRHPSRHSCRFLDDRGRSGDLRLIARLGLRLPKRRIRLQRGSGCNTGLSHGSLTGAGAGRAALKRPQAVLELPVAVLQLFILAGELPQLILKLLDPHFRIDIIGLREGL